MDGAGSIWHLYTNQIPAQFDFDGAGLVLKLMDLNTTLLKDQHLFNIVEIAKTKDLPAMGATLTKIPIEDSP